MNKLHRPINLVITETSPTCYRPERSFILKEVDLSILRQGSRNCVKMAAPARAQATENLSDRKILSFFAIKFCIPLI
jgi:hypothetical protein